MANTFTRKLERNVGTTAAPVGSYTVPASTTTIVVGLSVTNTTSSAITANVFINNGVANTYIIARGPVPAGSSLVVGGGDQKLVLITGDTMYVQSSAGTSIDTTMSILEIT
jgi:hypothetical protein